MTSSTLAPPPGAAPPPVEPVPTLPVRPPFGRRRLFAEKGRTRRWALAGSAAVHLLVVALAAVFLRLGPSLAPEHPAPVETVEYFDLDFPEETAVAPLPAGDVAPAAPSAAQSSTPAPADPADRRRERGAQGPALVFPTTVPRGLPAPGGAPAEGTSGAGGAAPSAAGGGGDAGAGALRPGIRDPRLYAPEQAPATAREATPHERYMDRLHGKLAEYNDSILAEQERARKATDWTKKGKNGERWGVSPGKIHLGKVTIPPGNATIEIPSNSPEREEEARKEALERREIDRQEADLRRRETFQDRVKATRERKDAERKARQGGS